MSFTVIFSLFRSYLFFRIGILWASFPRRYVILLSAFLCQGLSAGYFFGKSRLLGAISDTFRSTKAEAGVIQSTMTALSSLFSVVGGAVIQKVGPKTVGLVSTLVFSIAIGLSYFATSVVYLILVQAVFAGISSAFTGLSLIAVLAGCFDGKSRMLALSIAICGGGAGGMAYSYLLQILLETYGLRGTYLVVGGLVLNVLPLILLWPAQDKYNTVQAQAENVNIQNADGSSNMNENQTTVSKISLTESIKSVFGNRVFVILAVGSAVLITGQLNVLIYVADMVLERFKDINTSSFAIFVFNLMSIFGRLAPGVVGQLPISIALIVPIAITALAIAGCLTLAFGNIAYIALIASGLVGSSYGMTTAFFVMTTVELVGKDNMPLGLGVISTLNGILSLSSGPAIGHIRDTTGSYIGGFIATAAIVCAGGLLLISAMWMTKRQK